MNHQNLAINKLEKHELSDVADEVLGLFTSIKGSSSCWSTEYLNELFNTESNLSLLARTPNGGIAGAIMFHHVNAINPLMLNEPHLFLRRLVVEPSLRRGGIGNRLLREAVKRLSRDKQLNSISKVGWQTNVDNVDALKFFDQMGFKSIGKISIGSHSDEIFSFHSEDFRKLLQ